jgi:Ca2+-binding EF-hand superfamily protein
MRVCVLSCAGENVDPKVVNACFDQMDEDGSKAVDFEEFCSFFGVKRL